MYHEVILARYIMPTTLQHEQNIDRNKINRIFCASTDIEKMQVLLLNHYTVYVTQNHIDSIISIIVKGCVYLLKTWTQKDVKEFIVNFFLSSIAIKDTEERNEIGI